MICLCVHFSWYFSCFVFWISWIRWLNFGEFWAIITSNMSFASFVSVGILSLHCYTFEITPQILDVLLWIFCLFWHLFISLHFRLRSSSWPVFMLMASFISYVKSMMCLSKAFFIFITTFLISRFFWDSFSGFLPYLCLYYPSVLACCLLFLLEALTY